MSILVIQFYNRRFVVKKVDGKYPNFIVREFSNEIKENDIITLKAVNSELKVVDVQIQLVKKLKNKVISFTKKRRKGHKRYVGYNQNVGYFKVVEKI